MTPGWPLSAPATALLRSLRTSEGELLRLGIRHLVLVGAWRVEAGPLPRKRLGWQPKREVRLHAAAGPVPGPLRRLDRTLRAGLPDAQSSAAAHVVRAAMEHDRTLAAAVRHEAVRELVSARLVHEEPRPLCLGARRELTPTGRAWQAGIPSTHAAWQRDLRTGGAAAGSTVASAGAAPGLLLAADSSLLADLDRELRRVRRGDGGGGDVAVDIYLDVDGLDGLIDGCGDALDGLKGLGDLDFGISDLGGEGGGGGDGGGGDGGGGGD